MKEGKQSAHGQLLVGRTPSTHVFKLGGRTQLKRACSRISKEKLASAWTLYHICVATVASNGIHPSANGELCIMHPSS